MRNTDVKQMLRSDLKDFKPYKANNIPFRHKLDANESQFGMPENMKQRLISFLNDKELNFYPDSDNTQLRNMIADFYNIQPENVTCGVGSDQIIDFACKAFLGCGDAAIVLNPTFSMYELTTHINKGRVINIPLDESFSVDEKLVVSQAKVQNAKLIFLCTPNNPSGNSLSDSQLHYIMKNTYCPVVVDEAYGEFSGRSMLPYISKYPHMLIIKTFSKLYGLAGIRAGYALASEQMIEALDIVRPPYNLSTMSQFIAALALEFANEYKIRRNIIVSERERLINEMKNINGIKVYPSDANFIFFEAAIKIDSFLKSKGVLIRKFSKGVVGERLRLSVGTPEQNNEVLSLIREYLSERGFCNEESGSRTQY